jgi:hypothetical protein
VNLYAARFETVEGGGKDIYIKNIDMHLRMGFFQRGDDVIMYLMYILSQALQQAVPPPAFALGQIKLKIVK